MLERPDSTDDGAPVTSAHSALENLLYAALEAHADGGDAGLAALLALHPDHADELRARLERLRELGLLGAQERARAPEQLEHLGGFRLLERIGEGGMGLVWIAEEVALGRRVALKMVRPEHVWFRETRERFRREVEAVARLQHPGIVPIYAFGEEGGVPFFTMELVDGCTLADLLRVLRGRDPRTLSGAELARAIEAASPLREPGSTAREPGSTAREPGSTAREPGSTAREPGSTAREPGSPARARGARAARSPFEASSWSDACVAIARQVAEALDYAHGRGLVHRDVKPSNIALTRSGRAMLLDFGLARSDSTERMTRSGSQPGSLPYMSPEQIRGDAQIDARTDVYSLGVTLYELLTLTHAFASDSAETVRRQVLAGEFDRPRVHHPSIPWDIETVCLKAMAREPHERYARADDLARDFTNVLERRPIDARRAGLFLRVLRWSQRHPRASASLLAAAPLAIAALAGIAWLERHGRATETLLRTRADENAALADAQREQVLRLSDVRRLADLQRDADKLWPATPTHVEALTEWLARGTHLVDRLGAHREALAQIERGVGATRTSDGSWRFASAEEQWHHDTLAELIASLEAIAQPGIGLIDQMRGRLDFANSIEARSRGDAEPRRRWDEAVRSIADPAQCPAYAALALEPQLGLLPIGRDPASGLWEFAHLQTGEIAKRGADGKLVLKEETGLVLVLIPGGTFRMGAQRTDPNRDNYDPQSEVNELPIHALTLAPFLLSKYEMTQGQWERFTGRNPSQYGPRSGFVEKQHTLMLPVEQVSWEDCTQMLARLELVLPSEAQWEYAARANTGSVWWTGDAKESVEGAANLADAYCKRHGGPSSSTYEEWLDDDYAIQAPIGTYRANAFGLHEVIGNVWEWCRDGYGGYDLPVRARDGERQVAGLRNRVGRGGSYLGKAELARSATRGNFSPELRHGFLGLRPARSLTAD